MKPFIIYKGESKGLALEVENLPADAVVSLAVVGRLNEVAALFTTADGSLALDNGLFYAELTAELTADMFPGDYRIEGRVESPAASNIEILTRFELKNNRIYEL